MPLFTITKEFNRSTNEKDRLSCLVSDELTRRGDRLLEYWVGSHSSLRGALQCNVFTVGAGFGTSRLVLSEICLCVDCTTNPAAQMRLTVKAVGQLTEDSIYPAAKDELLAAFRDWKKG